MNKIYVGNLSYKTTDGALREFFAEFGDIEDAVIITERETGRSKGFGFVTFKTANSANDAVQKTDGQMLDGRAIRVNIAQNREGGAGGGARSGGGGRSGERSGGGGGRARY